MLKITDLFRGLTARGEDRKADAALAFKHMISLAADRPLDLNIEVTNFCASSCVFCPNSKVKRVKENMTMPLFRRICDEYADMGGGFLGLSSMQSDLFADQQLLERIAYLEQHRDTIRLYTTTYVVGAAKYTDDQLERLVRAFAYFQVSLGGWDAESYQRMYGTNGFETARKQLLRIKRIVEDKGLSVRLELMFRTQDPTAVANSALVRELTPTFRVVENRNNFFNWGGIISQEDLPKGAVLDVADNTAKRSNCAASVASMSIGVDGTIVGCGCVDWNARHIVGHVGNRSLLDVWRDRLAVEFREGFSRGNVPDLCKDCSLYTPVDLAFAKPTLKHYKPSDGVYYTL